MTSSATPTPRSGPSQRRAAIVAAAAQLFRQRGFAHVGIDDIGAEIGLSGPALYRYFDGKQTLLAEIVIGHLDRIADECDARLRVDDGSPPVAAHPRAREPQVDPELVRALVVAAMRQPNARYVMVRYADALTGDPLARVRERRAQFDAAWDPLLPHLDDGGAWSEAALRTRAVAGLLTHLALARSGSRAQRGELGRRCIEDLAAVSLRPIGPASAEPAGAPLLTHHDRREAILAIAIPLFCERGYAAVSLNDIGAQLGITGSAVARQFGSKEDLLAAAIMRGSEQISAGVARALRRSASASEAARAMLTSYVSLAVDFPELVVVQNIEPYALSAHYRSERRKRHRVYVDELARAIELADPQIGRVASRLRAGAAFGALNEVIVGGVRMQGAVDSMNLLRIASTIALPFAPRT